MPERRQAEAARIREKYPDRIPVWNLFLTSKVLSISYIMCLNFVVHYFPDAIQVIVEKAERSDIPDIDKKKLVYILIIISLYPYFMKFVHIWILVIFETLLFYEIFVSYLVRLEFLTLLACWIGIITVMFSVNSINWIYHMWSRLRLCASI